MSESDSIDRILDHETIPELIKAHAEKFSGQTFLYRRDPSREAGLTFHGLQGEVSRLGNALFNAKLKPGDRVGIYLPNGADFAISLLGIAAAGLVAIPLNTEAEPVEVRRWLSLAKVSLIIVPDWQEVLSEFIQVTFRELLNQPPLEDEDRPSPHPDSIALIDFTSGSTGTPKGVMVTHRQLLHGAANSVEAHRLDTVDHCLCVMPLYHMNAQVISLLATLQSGGSLTIRQSFRASEFLSVLESTRCTWVALVPSMIAQLSQFCASEVKPTHSLRFARSSSAPLAPHLHEWFEEVFDIPLLEAMGTTEAASAILSNPLPPAERKIGSPGIPWGFEVEVRSDAGIPVPTGEVGTLWVRGPSVMKGYLDSPDETAAALSHDGWLKLGDLGSVDSDGFVFITGRASEVIIKSGENISPREIDEALMRHPAVEEAAVTSVPHPTLGEDIVGFIITQQEAKVTGEELISWCIAEVGHFKSPGKIYKVDSLPRGAANKVLRHQLRDLAEEKAEETLTEEPTEASRAIEDELSAIWSRHLIWTSVDKNTPFFSLGGTSLIAIQILSDIEKAFQINLTLTEFLDYPNVRAQAIRIASRAKPVRTPLAKTPVQDRLALTPAQKRIWFLQQLYPESPQFNESSAFRLPGGIRKGRLKSAINRVISKHEALRIRIDGSTECPCQTLESRPGPAIRFQRIRANDLEQVLHEEVTKPFDLSSSPLFRTSVFKTETGEVILLFVFHHLVFDNRSVRVFLNDFAEAYQNGKAPDDLETISFSAFCLETDGKTLRSESVDFWKAQFQKVPRTIDLPFDRPRSAEPNFAGSRTSFEINPDLFSRLQELASAAETTCFSIITSLVFSLLHRYSQQNQVVLGLPVSGRSRNCHQQLIAPLIEVLPMPFTRISGETIHESCKRFTTEFRRCLDHRDLPLEQILEIIDIEREVSHSPLFQVMLNWRQPVTHGVAPLLSSSYPTHNGQSKYELTFFFEEGNESLRGEVEYPSALFDSGTIDRIIRQFLTLLKHSLEFPKQTLESLPLDSSEVFEQTIRRWSTAKAREVSPGSVIETLARTIKVMPEAPAVVTPEGEWSYRELDARTNRIAGELNARGVSKGDFVALAFEKPIDFVLGIVATLKSGAAYLPIDRSAPISRTTLILERSAPQLVLTHDWDVEAETKLPLNVWDDHFSGEDFNGGETEFTLPDFDLESPAYVLHTSGSTGTPKGVVMPHGALANLVSWLTSLPGHDQAPRVLQYAPFSFDIHFQELFGTWAVGGTLVLCPSEIRPDFPILLRLLNEEKINRCHLPPVVLQQIAVSALELDQFPTYLTDIYAAGEALQITPEIRQFFERIPECRLHNHYGPTETHVASSYSLIGPPQNWPVDVPIGTPIPGVTLKVIDPNGNDTPLGLSGELLIGGSALALEYLDDATLTKQQFVSIGSSRFYRTGDLVCWSSDGQLLFQKRKDRQLKIRGYRVEPLEIEAALLEHEDVREAVVAKSGISEDLIAYYTGSGPLTLQDLGSHLREILPGYMIPRHFVFVEKMPLSKNGKIDFDALSRIEPEGGEEDNWFSNLMTPTQEIVSGIWRQVLGHTASSPNSTFFELGGHSLLAAQMANRVRDAFEVEVPLRTIFDHPTVATFSSAVDRLRASALRIEIPPLPKADREKRQPLTSSQQRIWKNNRDHVGNRVARAYSISGPLDEEALQFALDSLVVRHEPLRTTFGEEKDVPFQLVYPPASVSMKRSEVSNSFTEVEEESEFIMDWVEKNKALPIDLTKDPAFQVSLLRLDEGKYILLIILHHIICDSVTLARLLEDLSIDYNAFRSDRNVSIRPAPERQLIDYASWESSQPAFLQEAKIKLVDHWKAILGRERETLDLSFLARGEAEPAKLKEARVTHLLDEEFSARCRRFSDQHGVSDFSLFMATFMGTLHRCTEQRELLIGAYSSTRNHPEIENSFGCFVTLIPLFSRITSEKTLISLTKEIQSVLLDAQSFRSLSFDELCETLGGEGFSPPAPNAIFQYNSGRSSPELGDTTSHPWFSQRAQEMPWGFTLAVNRETTGMNVQCIFDTFLYAPSKAAEFLKEYEQLLRAVLADPTIPVRELQIEQK